MAVKDSFFPAAHHPAGRAHARFEPLRLVFVIDSRNPSTGIGNGQRAIPDVQPVDVHIISNLVGDAGNFPGEIIDIAVITSGIEPDIVGNQALDALWELIVRLHPAVVVEPKDIASLIPNPALSFVNKNAEGGAAGGKCPEHGSLAGC